MTETGKHVLRAAAAPPRLAGAAARGGWRRQARVTAAPLAAVALAGLLAGAPGQARPPAAKPTSPLPKAVYVVDADPGGPGMVTPISLATNKPGKPIPVGRQPLYIAVTPDGKTAYVTNDTAGTMTP